MRFFSNRDACNAASDTFQLNPSLQHALSHISTISLQWWIKQSEL